MEMKEEDKTEDEENDQSDKSVIDPWSYQHKFTVRWVIQAIFLGPILLPLRLLSIGILVIIGLLLALIGSCVGGSMVSGFKGKLRNVMCLVIRLVGKVMGVWLDTEGEQVDVKEAPLLVISPHSTILDWTLIGITRGCPVAKAELAKGWVTGPVGRLLGTVWVERGEGTTKKNVVSTLIERSVDPDWPQTVIFPEGTTTNGSALVQFRAGAFSAGRPVQPVLITHHNKVDTVTWAWNMSYTVSQLVMLTLLTPLTRVRIQYLPVIRQDPGEESNPRLFADHVRYVMAKELGLPTLDVTLKDAVSSRNINKDMEKITKHNKDNYKKGDDFEEEKGVLESKENEKENYTNIGQNQFDDKGKNGDTKSERKELNEGVKINEKNFETKSEENSKVAPIDFVGSLTLGT